MGSKLNGDPPLDKKQMWTTLKAKIICFCFPSLLIDSLQSDFSTTVVVNGCPTQIQNFIETIRKTKRYFFYFLILFHLCMCNLKSIVIYSEIKHEYLRSRAYMYMFVTFIFRWSLLLDHYRDTRASILDLASGNFCIEIKTILKLLSFSSELLNT